MTLPAGAGAVTVVVDGGPTSVVEVAAVPVPGPQGPQGPPGPGGMVWRGVWAAGSYAAGDVVRDAGWLMIATAPTSDRAAPQPDTGQRWLQADAPAWQTMATSVGVLDVGVRALSRGAAYLTAVRYWDPSGVGADVSYDVRVELEPATVAERTIGVVDRAAPTGTDAWVVVPLSSPVLVLPGQTFGVVLTVRNEASPTDTILTYGYTTPNNTGTPSSGDIRHQNATPDQLLVSKTGSGGADNSAFLATLGPQWSLLCEAVTWTILAAVDRGSYVELAIEPPVQLGSDNTKSFVFRQLNAAPLDVLWVPDFWAPSADVAGTLDDPSDTSPPSVVEHAYGVDAAWVDVLLSPSWEVVMPPARDAPPPPDVLAL